MAFLAIEVASENGDGRTVAPAPIASHLDPRVLADSAPVLAVKLRDVLHALPASTLDAFSAEFKLVVASFAFI